LERVAKPKHSEHIVVVYWLKNYIKLHLFKQKQHISLCVVNYAAVAVNEAY
jgi:hypothetical protein